MRKINKMGNRMTDELSQQCRTLLYRMMWQTPAGVVDAFALADNHLSATAHVATGMGKSAFGTDTPTLFDQCPFLLAAGFSAKRELRYDWGRRTFSIYIYGLRILAVGP
ncbi:hypothetical protein C0Z16_32190 [Paraburkholderia rhynchosiae]|uniref:Uncharacterized protein n=2 Tax=Paraburkholderia rhynchosiae TaxID=487049 RepID=A0ABX4UXH1_9BURK|nr:hypothetical protein C0Z16_32190 [Paraburkholderia rhynchosiae]